MTIRSCWLQATLMTLFCGSTALAGGPVAKDIPAAAKAYVHVDLAAFRQTDAYKALQRIDAINGPLQARLTAVAQVTGIDPLNDLNGVTIYTSGLWNDAGTAPRASAVPARGTAELVQQVSLEAPARAAAGSLAQVGAGSGVVLLYGKIDRADLLKRLASAERYTETPYGKHTICTWFAARMGKTMAAVIDADGPLVLAPSAEQMRAAMNVFDGKVPGNCRLAQNYPAGAFLHIAFSDIQGLRTKPASQLMRIADAVELSATEKTGTLSLALTVATQQPEQAAQLKEVAEGVKAFLMLQRGDDADVSTVFNSFSVKVDGSRATVTFEGPGRQLFRDIQVLHNAAPTARLNAKAAE